MYSYYWTPGEFGLNDTDILKEVMFLGGWYSFPLSCFLLIKLFVLSDKKLIWDLIFYKSIIVIFPLFLNIRSLSHFNLFLNIK